jgi:hypothetical protein
MAALPQPLVAAVVKSHVDHLGSKPKHLLEPEEREVSASGVWRRLSTIYLATIILAKIFLSKNIIAVYT